MPVHTSQRVYLFILGCVIVQYKRYTSNLLPAKHFVYTPRDSKILIVYIKIVAFENTGILELLSGH